MPDLKEAYRRLDPALPLSAEQLESFYVPRPNHPIGILAEELLLRDDPGRFLLIGQRGVGKSSDLMWLEHRIQAEEPSRVIIRVQLESTSGATNAKRIVEQLTESIVERRNQLNLQGFQLPDNFWDLREYLYRGKGVGNPEAADVLKQTIEEKWFPQLKCLPIFLLDGGERLESSTFLELKQNLTTINAMVVFAAPVRVSFDPRFVVEAEDWERRIELPALNVLSDESGLHALDAMDTEISRRVIEQRVGHDAFGYGCLDVLIPASAGLHRELLSLCQLACLQAVSRKDVYVTRQFAEIAVEQRRHNFGSLLTPEDLRILEAVQKTNTIQHDERTLRLIDLNMIVIYNEGWTRFRVNPLILPHLERVRKYAS